MHQDGVRLGDPYIERACFHRCCVRADQSSNDARRKLAECVHEGGAVTLGLEGRALERDATVCVVSEVPLNAISVATRASHPAHGRRQIGPRPMTASTGGITI